MTAKSTDSVKYQPSKEAREARKKRLQKICGNSKNSSNWFPAFLKKK